MVIRLFRRSVKRLVRAWLRWAHHLRSGRMLAPGLVKGLVRVAVKVLNPEWVSAWRMLQVSETARPLRSAGFPAASVPVLATVRRAFRGR